MLLDAQNKAAELFAGIERSGMIRAGVREQELSDEIRDLAAEMFGVSRHWHKRIVRTGENTHDDIMGADRPRAGSAASTRSCWTSADRRGANPGQLFCHSRQFLLIRP